MKQILLATLLMLLAVPHGVLLAQQGTRGAAEAISFNDLFPQQARPTLSGKPIPSSAGFFTIDPIAFDRLGAAPRTPIRIERFPLEAGRSTTLLLHAFEVLSPGGAIVAATERGEQEVALPHGLFFTGSAPAIPGSFVYLAVFRDYCSGYIELPSEGGTIRHSIAPLALTDGAPATMVIYDEAEALRITGVGAGKDAGWHCSAEELPEYQPAVDGVFKNYGRSGRKSRQLQGNNLLAAQIAIDCDSAYYVAHGRNLSRATNYALTVMGAVSAVYQRDMNVIVQVPYVRIWTGRDPYPGTSANTLLGQFRSYWNSNMTTVRRTVAHLFSTSSIGGGVAYLNTICANTSSGYGYAVIGLNNNVIYPTTAYVWDTDVAAHEMGHNFGSPHTHSCAWEPAIDSCFAAEGGCFSGTKGRVGTIMSYCHLTPFGTELYFHPRAADLIRSNAELATCIGALEGSSANDVATTNINVPAPGGRIAAASQFTPSAVFRNAGTNTQPPLTVTMIFRDSLGTQIYSNTQTIASLAAGATATVAFTQTSISAVARYSAVVSIALASDSYQANNTLVRPFEIVSATSGSISILAPNTATAFKAGSTATISWSYSGAISSARLDFSPDDGASWFTIATNLNPAAGSLAWIVPQVNTSRARIRISDRDNAATFDLCDHAFSILTLPLDWQWARSAGATREDEARAVALDSRGNLLLAGSFSDSIRFGATRLTSAGGSDAFLAKFSPGGSLLWAKAIGGSGNDSATAVAVDASGNILVAGGFFSTVTIGSTSLSSSGDQDVFVARYDADGALLWAQKSGGSGRDQAKGVAADASGNALVAGVFSGTASFGATSLSSAGSTDGFVAKYAASNGVAQWAQKGGGSDVDEAVAIAADASGNSYIAGRFRGTAAIAGVSLTSAGGDDQYVAKYNSSGAGQWSASAGGGSSDEGRGVAVDAAGNVYVGGTISGLVNFATVYATSAGGKDVSVAKYNSAGVVQWVRTGGSSSDESVGGVSVDGSGNVYVSGSMQGTLRLGELSVVSVGGSDVMVAKLSSDGDVSWVRRGGGAVSEEGHAIAVNPAGDHGFVAGKMTSLAAGLPSIFGPESILGIGSSDAFVARIGMFRVTSPREADSWSAGSSRAITWSTFSAANVKIEYSTNHGAAWSTITPSAPNNGSYNWTLPTGQQSQVMIRVSDADNPSLLGAATSGTFTLIGTAPPTNLVATPFDGLVDLSWTGSISSGVTGYAIYRGTSPQNLALIATTDGTKRAYIDRTVINCTNYVYGIKALAGATESLMSDLATARPEAPKALAITGITANENIPAGSTRGLTWLSTGCIDQVELSYTTNAGESWNPIVTQTANNGSFSWTVPGISAARVLLKIADKQNPAISDLSDPFRICNLPATVVISGQATICGGEETILSAPAGFSAYLWSNGATTREITVAQSGSYSVTVTDAGGCSVSSAQMVVKVNPKPQPVVTAIGATAFCQGESVTLRAPDGFASYQWSTGHTGREITVVQTGSYWVMVTDINGCTGSSQPTAVTANPKPQPAITASGPTSFYAGQSVTLSAPAGYPEYRWSNGATTHQITISEPGSYSVTVTDANGCTGRSGEIAVKIIPKSQPTISAEGLTAVCYGDSVTLVAADGYAAYRWSNGATTRIVRVGESGSYTVTTTDAGGQNGTSEPIVVTVHAPLTRPVLTRRQGTDSLFYSGASGTVLWQRDGEPIAGASGIVHLALAEGIYTAAITDSNGCTAVSDPLPVTLTMHSGFPTAGERGLSIHPNPSAGRFTIELTLSRTMPLRIVMVDIAGNEVLRIEEPATVGAYRREIDATGLPSGAYVLELRAGSRIWREKVVRQ